jgi:tetratricopeptide (TPR) repeat protein
MKRTFLVFCLFFVSLAVFAQSLYNFRSDHYNVNSQISESHAGEVAKKMEAALLLYNQILHFDLTKLSTKLKVTVYRDKSSFDAYLSSILDQSRESFVYIHYSDIRKSELIAFQKADEQDFDSSLLHQGLIQFFKAFVPNPPIWIREGLATYVENSYYDETRGKFAFRPNLAWLESLKGILRGTEAGKSPIPLSVLLAMDRSDVKDRINVFYPQAWGIVTFLLNSNMRDYSRILWDSLKLLDAEKSVKENSVAVMREVFGWYDESLLVKDFTDYILTVKTFNELVTEGINHYTLDEFEKAGDMFMDAITLEPQNYIPYYYLGLISYAMGEYAQADGYYQAALALGAEEATTKYALGVNAFADNRLEIAVAYLTEAKELNPGKYSEKVDSLLQRIENLR